MDLAFETYVQELMSQDDVKGILVADETGLCLTATGIAPASASGYIAAISHHAKELSEFHHKEHEVPTTIIQQNTMKIFVRMEGSFTIAIYRQIA
ncbi:hypothetical protein DSO57_1009359 [Entomophthora muscae]|uniref:Uncharacterized protein n=6 Tax=Entomophthora muscae TaxID=34485 RepID=A0ACC2TUJ0_9FUNG|nr:hypothetical protein DSO57_1021964 [Entomophthora muscae]KAJ9078185.1 hypothetical protein DSO57_1009359 [Entomophthora muscae]